MVGSGVNAGYVVVVVMVGGSLSGCRASSAALANSPLDSPPTWPTCSLRNTHLCGARNDSGDGALYSLEGVQVLCDALVHHNCVLECLDVSDNGIKVCAHSHHLIM